MQIALQPIAQTNKTLWTGRILSSLVVVMLTLDGVMKLIKPAPVAEAMTKLGYPQSTSFGIGILLLACTALYSVRQTAVLGAILLTGFLGGATATNVRVEAGAFPILFPSILGALIWGGLLLRDEKLRNLMPLRIRD